MKMTVYVPDELGERVKAADDLNVSAVCQEALQRELARRQRYAELAEGMEPITLEVGDPPMTIGFEGRWLVYPDPDETRTSEEGYDAGDYYGVALTKRHRIAVYVAHCNDRWPAMLSDYDHLDAAVIDNHPSDIVAMAAVKLGEQRIVWRDI